MAKKKIPKPDACKDYTRQDGKWYLGGKEVDEETALILNKRAIPPAWTDVVVARDPMQEMQAIGRDGSGKWQYKYSDAHNEEASDIKFIRIRKFTEKVSDIRHSYSAGVLKDDAFSWALKIEDSTAIRVGSTLKLDAPIESRAYGLTTLTKEHVIIDKGKVRLDFIAKCGKHAVYDIEDPEISKYLIRRYAEMKAGEDLFPTVTAEKINKHLRKITGEYLKFHDFRGYHGTRMANEMLASFVGKILSVEQKIEIVKEICGKVSAFLHNTPKVTFEHYIDPKVWDAIGGVEEVGMKHLVEKKPKTDKIKEKIEGKIEETKKKISIKPKVKIK